MSLERKKLSGRYDAPTLAYIYDVLVKYAGARDDEYDKNTFVQCAFDWDYNFNFEYRFMGKLGFGGKVWLPLDENPSITCYREDETPERKKMIKKTNDELVRLMDETGARR